MEVGARWRDDKHGIREGNNRELDGTRRGSDSGHHLANGRPGLYSDPTGFYSNRTGLYSNAMVHRVIQKMIYTVYHFLYNPVYHCIAV